MAQVARVVRAYNELRPYGSCDFLTPAQAQEREGPLVQRWKNCCQPTAKMPTNLYPVQSPNRITASTCKATARLLPSFAQSAAPAGKGCWADFCHA